VKFQKGQDHLEVLYSCVLTQVNLSRLQLYRKILSAKKNHKFFLARVVVHTSFLLELLRSI